MTASQWYIDAVEEDVPTESKLEPGYCGPVPDFLNQTWFYHNDMTAEDLSAGYSFSKRVTSSDDTSAKIAIWLGECSAATNSLAFLARQHVISQAIVNQGFEDLRMATNYFEQLVTQVSKRKDGPSYELEDDTSDLYIKGIDTLFANVALGDQCGVYTRVPFSNLSTRNKWRGARKFFCVADSTPLMMSKSSGKNRKTDNEALRWYLDEHTCGSYEETILWHSFGAGVRDIRRRLVKWVNREARGQASNVYNDLIIIISFNDLIDGQGNGRNPTPEEIYQMFVELANYLTHFQRVSIVAAGDEVLWEIPGFNASASKVINLFRLTGHIVYSGCPIYDQMTKFKNKDSWHFQSNPDHGVLLARMIWELFIFMLFYHNLKAV